MSVLHGLKAPALLTPPSIFLCNNVRLTDQFRKDYLTTNGELRSVQEVMRRRFADVELNPTHQLDIFRLGELFALPPELRETMLSGKKMPVNLFGNYREEVAIRYGSIHSADAGRVIANYDQLSRTLSEIRAEKLFNYGLAGAATAGALAYAALTPSSEARVVAIVAAFAFVALGIGSSLISDSNPAVEGVRHGHLRESLGERFNIVMIAPLTYEQALQSSKIFTAFDGMYENSTRGAEPKMRVEGALKLFDALDTKPEEAVRRANKILFKDMATLRRVFFRGREKKRLINELSITPTDAMLVLGVRELFAAQPQDLAEILGTELQLLPA